MDSQQSRCMEHILLVGFIMFFLSVQLKTCWHVTPLGQSPSALTPPVFPSNARILIEEETTNSSGEGEAAASAITAANTSNEEQVYNFSADRPGCQDVSIPIDLFVPIFIMTRDRVSSLREALESYESTIASPYQIIILDHNSTYEPMLEYLDFLQKEKNITVHPLQEANWNKAIVESANFIGAYRRAHPEVKYYILTDPGKVFILKRGMRCKSSCCSSSNDSQ
jgi:hypothetical protein